MRFSLLAYAVIALVFPLFAESSPAHAQCYGVTQAGLDLGNRDIARSCSGARADADKCYEAARVFVAINGKDRLCPGVDPRQRAADVTNARRIMATVRSRSPGVAARNAAAGREYNRPRGAGGGYAPAYRPPPANNGCPVNTWYNGGLCHEY